MIPIIKPCLGEPEANAAARVVKSGWVTQGPEAAAFECEFAAAVGAQYACAVSNCTTALHLVLLAAGVGSGDEVVTVSHSFIATANAVRYCGAVPVFVDIDPTTGNMTPSGVEKAIGPKTKAVMAVHQGGMPCDMEGLAAICAKKGVFLIEDAACAIGCEALWKGKMEKIGKPHGDAACFSFHPRKVLTTGDGGMITTRHAEWDEICRKLRQHYMDVSDLKRHDSSSIIFEQYPRLGYNYRMTDIQAAVGREQLKRLPEIVARRRQLADRYRELLAAVPGIYVPVEPSWGRTNWQSFWIRLPQGIEQRTVMQSMLDAEVSTRRGIMCAHAEKAYAPGGQSWRCGDDSGLVHSLAQRDGTILLPLYHDMTEVDQDTVVNALTNAL